MCSLSVCVCVYVCMSFSEPSLPFRALLFGLGAGAGEVVSCVQNRRVYQEAFLSLYRIYGIEGRGQSCEGVRCRCVRWMWLGFERCFCGLVVLLL